MATNTRKKKQKATRWHDGSTSVDDLQPDEQLAHQIVSRFGDLAPSVERIMDAAITDAERMAALTAFENSLGRIGDSNRDPRIAIINATATATSP
jgi:hypothetical protein